MVSNSTHLQEPIPNNAELIGSFFTGNHAPTPVPTGHCPVCHELLIPQAKFCGDCGNPTGESNQAGSNQSKLRQMHTHGVQAARVPAFAQVSHQLRKSVPPELKKEHGKLTILLAREQFFLIAHYLIFLGANLCGFWASFKAYNGLYADEISRTVIALFPLFFINTVALSALVPIGGTKKEIARLKERLTYLHYQIEYVNLK